MLVEVNCETDFVAKTEDFQRFIKDVAMQIAGAHPAPLYVAEADMDPTAVEKEREIRVEAARNPKQVPGEKLKVMPEAIDRQDRRGADRQVEEGRLPARPDLGPRSRGQEDHRRAAATSWSPSSARTSRSAASSRCELGEGLEKKKDDFAAEVAKQAGL